MHFEGGTAMIFNWIWAVRGGDVGSEHQEIQSSSTEVEWPECEWGGFFLGGGGGAIRSSLLGMLGLGCMSDI